MYTVYIKNDFGTIEISDLSRIKLTSALGVGAPKKSATVIEFADSPGRKTTNIKDAYRTITLAGDICGSKQDISGIYKILSKQCRIIFILGTQHREISGLCINPDDIKNEGGGFWSYVLQFECDDPYFYDVHESNIGIFSRNDLWPNGTENGAAVVSLPSIATERLTEADVTNSGDADLYPILIIENDGADCVSGDSITITNETTDVSIVLNYAISGGERITVNLPDREITSLKNGVSSEITSNISNDTYLDKFLIKIGKNHMSVAVTTNQSAQLTCRLKYKNKYFAVVV